MAISLIQLSDDVQPVVSAGDFTGDRTDLCWSDQESILAFIFMSIGCLFICLSIYLLYRTILCMLALHSMWHIYRFHILVGLLCCDLFLIGWELQKVKGPIPRPRDT